MKPIRLWILSFILGLFFLLPAAALAQESVVLTMGSWRTDDIRQMQAILDQFTRLHPNIKVVFDPTPAPEYDEVLLAQLQGGTAPDVFYLRSFGVSRNLYEQGFLAPLDDLPYLHEHFAPESLEPWTSNGVTYGVPMIATSHGVYYNKDIFTELGLSVPETWAGLLDAAKTIQAAGITPFANASGDSWTINEIVFYNIAPTFIGGRAGRLEYLEGRRCFDDADMVAAFQALADLAPFLPPNQALLGYTDSLQLFLKGKAAMWLGGSWDIPLFETSTPSFAWSVFAPPPPEGKAPQITFHLDAGMGLNAATRHREAARTLLEWLCSQEFGALMGNELPGFFPMHKVPPVLRSAHAAAFLSLNEGRGTDVRLVWDKLRDGQPSGYDLTLDAAVGVINGSMTPAGAAESLQQGLAQWYEPAQRCGR